MQIQLHKDLKVDLLFQENRLFRILNKRLKKSSSYSESLMEILKGYINGYLNLSSNDVGEAIEAYQNFMKAYHNDMVEFVEHGKFPLELDPKQRHLSRFEYDAVLLLSCILTEHRYRLMQLIHDKSEDVANALFVGCGPGLEFELVKSKIKNIDAFDISISEELKNIHPKINFHECLFDRSKSDETYESIYLIELLEHLKDPYELLNLCADVLQKSGNIYCTTATNIPQFDHLYNFKSDHIEFENEIDKLGLQIDFMEELVHEAVTINIGAKNRFYILSKKQRK